MLTKPEGENRFEAPSRPLSKFKYFVVLLSIALATASDGGLLALEGMIASPG